MGRKGRVRGEDNVREEGREEKGKENDHRRRTKRKGGGGNIRREEWKGKEREGRHKG